MLYFSSVMSFLYALHSPAKLVSFLFQGSATGTLASLFSSYFHREHILFSRDRFRSTWRLSTNVFTCSHAHVAYSRVKVNLYERMRVHCVYIYIYNSRKWRGNGINLTLVYRSRWRGKRDGPCRFLVDIETRSVTRTCVFVREVGGMSTADQ